MLEIGASFDRFIIDAHLGAGGMVKNVYRERQVVPAWDPSLREPDRADQRSCPRDCRSSPKDTPCAGA